MAPLCHICHLSQSQLCKLTKFYGRAGDGSLSRNDDRVEESCMSMSKPLGKTSVIDKRLIRFLEVRRVEDLVVWKDQILVFFLP